MHWGHLQISQYAKSNKKIIFKKYAMNYLKENLIFNNFNIIKKKDTQILNISKSIY